MKKNFVLPVRKRNIAAILITTAVLAAANNWYLFKPVALTVDVTGKGNCTIEAQLNKKDNNEFKKIRKDIKTLNLNDKSEFEFFIKRSKFPKRLRFVIEYFDPSDTLEISSITAFAPRGGGQKSFSERF